MSQTKQDDSLTKRKTKPEEEVKPQQRAAATSKSEDKKSQGAQPSGGFKLGWLIGGSVMILALALLYTRNVEQGAQKKDHPVRETEQTQTHVPEHDADYKGFLYVEEKWKNVFKVEKLGSAVTLYTLRCTNSGPEAYDVVLPKVVQDIGEHTNIKNFTLAQPICKSLTDTGVKGLGESIGKYLSKIESLDLQFYETGNIGDAGVKSLITSIGQNLRTLQHLSFLFHSTPSVTAETFNALASAMDQFPRSLSNFSMTSNHGPKVTTASVANLAESISRNFPKLAHLKFWFRMSSGITKDIMSDLSKPFSGLKDLEGLSLLFAGISGISTKEVQALTENMAGLSKLKSLSLVFMKSNLGVESLEALGKALAANHPGLSQLTVDLSWSSAVYDAGLEAFAAALKGKITNLKSLTLNIMGLEYVTDLGVKAIASILNEDRKSLEELALNMGFLEKITGAAVTELASTIEKNLHNLKKFRFALPSHDKLDDEAIKQVAAILRQNANGLRELELWFRGLRGVTGGGFNVLADILGNNLINLEKLTLEFSSCQNFKDEAASKVSDAISKRLPKLQELKLRVSELELTNFGIAAIIDSLAQFRQDLQCLSFELESLRNINDDLVLHLSNTIGKHFRGLERLTLAVTLAKEVTQKGVQRIEDMILNNLPNLRELTLKLMKIQKVKNSVLTDLVLNIIQKSPNINRLHLGYPQRIEQEERNKIRDQTGAIPYIIY